MYIKQPVIQQLTLYDNKGLQYILAGRQPTHSSQQFLVEYPPQTHSERPTNCILLGYRHRVKLNLTKKIIDSINFQIEVKYWFNTGIFTIHISDALITIIYMALTQVMSIKTCYNIAPISIFSPFGFLIHKTYKYRNV